MSEFSEKSLQDVFFVEDRHGGFLVYIRSDGGAWGELVGLEAWEEFAEAECRRRGRVFKNEGELEAYVNELKRN